MKGHLHHPAPAGECKWNVWIQHLVDAMRPSGLEKFVVFRSISSIGDNSLNKLILCPKIHFGFIRRRGL